MIQTVEQDPAEVGSHSLRIPLSKLPPQTKMGDTVEFAVDYIDANQGFASLSANKPDTENKPTDLPPDTPPEESPEEAPPKGNDTAVLLGPMSGLKNYLVQKSQDVGKNMGR